jgi:serine protease AprX
MAGPSEDHAHGLGGKRLAVAPVCERLDADPTLAGRGVTIAFLDSGFSPHPDLVSPGQRILAYRDVTGEDAPLHPAGEAEGWRWHGTQTSVVAAGNGHLSGGVYRGLASEAGVVLVKVGVQGRISEDNIGRGLAWVLENRGHHRIRVVSISLGGDEDAPLRENRVNQLAEECVRAGLVLVVAAGNSGCTARHRSLPPATAPSVITVGGYEETGDGDSAAFSLYCSSYGFTADGLVKPEIIALARGVAAPVLAGTKTFREAEIPYQEADGTSFAAPIVASVAAQMLEANPGLTPAEVKRLLVLSARRIAGASSLRQGFGVLDARGAVEAARRERHSIAAAPGPTIFPGERVTFVYHDDGASSVDLAGDFNGWRLEPMERCADGAWRKEVEWPSPGSYRYKLVVDGRWIEDPANSAKELDPYGSFNSLLRVS